MEHKIKIYKEGKLVRETVGKTGDTLLDVVSATGEFLDAPCGGQGKCGKCLVSLTPNGEMVKACTTKVEGDMEVYLPDQKMDEMKIATVGEGADHATDGHTGPYGVAVDIGTTTVVAHLTDLPTGKRIATSSGVNSQRTYGADVISRIQYCAENGHEALTKCIREQLAGLIRENIKKAGICEDDIVYMSIAGNTIMQHLFANMSPVGMGVVPFTPVSLFGEELPAGEDMPVNKNAKCYFAPCASSYVGGDITAGMMASGLLEDQGPTVYLDIGTNGEIGMKIGDKFLVCATAAGPAFEGAEITYGMAAVTGAINHARWVDGKLEYDVIGDAKPAGLCGSGLLDALAILLDTGAVDETGRMLDADEAEGPIAEYLGERNGKNAFFLCRETGVCVTADDIRKLQLAKAAIAAGINTLIKIGGAEKVNAFMLCGGFGSFMDKKSAARMGLFPASFLPVTQTLGNTAGEGAALAVWNAQARADMDKIIANCEYIELSDSRIFNDEFIEQMMFE